MCGMCGRIIAYRARVIIARRTSAAIAAIVLAVTALAAGCGDSGAADSWRPCSSKSFDASVGLGTTIELDTPDFAPSNIDRAAVCRYGEQATDENELSDDQIGDLHDTLARADDLSPDCPLEITSASEVLIVVVDLKTRDENAQFNFATGDMPCESIILRGRQLAADELGDLVRDWATK